MGSTIQRNLDVVSLLLLFDDDDDDIEVAAVSLASMAAALASFPGGTSSSPTNGFCVWVYNYYYYVCGFGVT